MLCGDARETPQLHYDRTGDGDQPLLRSRRVKGPSITEMPSKF
jgi:hypothetical protein